MKKFFSIVALALAVSAGLMAVTTLTGKPQAKACNSNPC